MATREMPAISAHSYTSNTIDPLAAAGIFSQQANQAVLANQMIGGTGIAGVDSYGGALAGRLQPAVQQAVRRPPQIIKQHQLEAEMAAATGRRYVQVFIADPDPKVPLASCLLYSSEPKMTDLTDEELFFEVEIKRILDEHNEKVRTVTVDKAIKDRTQYLEAARIRDLRMNVVTIAQF